MENALQEIAVLCVSEDPAYAVGWLAADLLAAGALVDVKPVAAPMDFAHSAYRLVLIDAAADDDRYFYFVATLRSAIRLPIMLVLRGSARDQSLRGFVAGADACLPAPYDPRELQARATALIRRELARSALTQTAV